MVIFHSYVNVYQRVFYKIKGHAIPNFQTHRPFVPKKIPKSPSTNFPTGTAIALKAPDNGEKKQSLYVVISYKARQRYYIYPWIMAKIRDSRARQLDRFD